MTPLLQVEGLTKVFGTNRKLFAPRPRPVRAVDGVSFDVGPGEVVGLAGESGSGKTTVGRSVLRLLEPTSGSVRFDGREVTALSPAGLRDFRRQAQIVFQDPFGSLDPKMTIGHSIAEPLRSLGIETNGARRRARVVELLDLVALSADYIDRSPTELSGGQRQRVGIARAIAANPRFIVADEPVSALDVSIQAQIVNLLSDLREKLSLAMLFISHDLAVMQHLADRIAVLYLGRIVEIGPAAEICQRPRHPYTIALLSAVPDPDPTRKANRIVLEGDIPSPTAAPSGCVFRTRCWKAEPDCAGIVPPPVAVGPGHSAACLHL